MIDKDDDMYCSCGGKLVPVMIEEEEEDKYGYPTGRKRRVCSHLTCSWCLKNVPVDGQYLASSWY